MDLSKLPKFSNTPVPPPPPATPSQPLDYRTVNPGQLPGAGMMIWVNLIVGVLAIFMGRSFAVYQWDQIRHVQYHTGVIWQSGAQAGQEVAYPDLDGFQMLTDAGIFFFGIIAVVEALIHVTTIMQIRLPIAVLRILLLMALVTTGLNLYAGARVMGTGAIPIFSGVAAIFSGFVVADSWALLASARRIIR